MFEIARTPAALFRQMREQGRPLAELEFVRRAYDFGVSLYTARFEVDGAPFQVHGIGTASALVQLGAPTHLIGVATFHNAFVSGDWADGRGVGPFPSRRAIVRDAVGQEAESLLFELFGVGNVMNEPVESLLARADEMEEFERWRVLHRLADLLDKWDDGRVMYSTDGRGDRAFVAGREAAIVALAEQLGSKEFAESLELAFSRVAAEEIPESLKLGRRYSVIVEPASSRARTSVRVTRHARRILGRLRQGLRRGT